MRPPPAGRPGKPPRVLVVGRSPEVLDAVTRELAELGLAVQGTVRPEHPGEAFDPAGFDLVAIGGGVDALSRASLKRTFAAQNPQLRLIDTYAPLAVRQILTALGRADPLPTVDLDRYCARIGYNGPRTADLATLRALHEQHPAAIPFEAIDVLLGRGIDLAPAAVDAKLIGAGRGGYCFEQNGLFRRVLTTMGYQASALMARVLWNLPAGSQPQPRTHMILEVDLDGTRWLVDVGFGSVVPTAPLRLDTVEPQETRHETFRVIPFGRELLLQVCRDGIWRPVYRISRDPAYEPDLEAANWYTATHPGSHFRRNLMVARTMPEARCTLLGRHLTIRRPGREAERRELDADGVEQALGGLFGLPVRPEWRPLIEQVAASG